VLQTDTVRGRELLSRFVSPIIMTPETENPVRRCRATGAFNLSFFLTAAASGESGSGKSSCAGAQLHVDNCRDGPDRGSGGVTPRTSPTLLPGAGSPRRWRPHEHDQSTWKVSELRRAIPPDPRSTTTGRAGASASRSSKLDCSDRCGRKQIPGPLNAFSVK
jgi:hypothetical protein